MRRNPPYRTNRTFIRTNADERGIFIFVISFRHWKHVPARNDREKFYKTAV